jgi:hypothetical protein
MNNQLTIPNIKHIKTKRKPDLGVRLFTVRGKERYYEGFSNVKISVAGKIIIIYGDGRIEEKNE